MSSLATPMSHPAVTPSEITLVLKDAIEYLEEGSIKSLV
jgi:hypothetical protein